MILVRFIFSSFWIWLGAALLIALPFETIVRIVRLNTRRAALERWGWPPEHLDADGDFKTQGKEKP